MWLNEGLAQYFETSYVVNQKLVVGSVSAEKLNAMNDLLRTKRAPATLAMVQMKPPEFYREPTTSYPMSWALVYYLQRGDYTVNPQKTFRAYLEDVKLGLTDAATFQKHFGADTPAWQARFEQFIGKLKSQVN